MVKKEGTFESKIPFNLNTNIGITIKRKDGTIEEIDSIELTDDENELYAKAIYELIKEELNKERSK